MERPMEAAIAEPSTEQHGNGNIPLDSVLGDMDGDDQLGVRGNREYFATLLVTQACNLPCL